MRTTLIGLMASLLCAAPAGAAHIFDPIDPDRPSGPISAGGALEFEMIGETQPHPASGVARILVDLFFDVTGTCAASCSYSSILGTEAAEWSSGDSVRIEFGQELALTQSYTSGDPSFTVRWELLPGTSGYDYLDALIDRSDPGLIAGTLVGISASSGSFWLTGFEVQDYSPSGLDFVQTTNLALIPEPSTALLLGLGLVGLAARRRV